MIKAFLWISLAFAIQVVQPAKVLVLPSTIYPVHPYTMKHLVDELAKVGHEVTWVEHGPVQSNVSLAKNVRSIFWKVDYDNHHLHEILVEKDHLVNKMLWEADFHARTEQTTGWIAGIRLCDNLLKKHKDDFQRIADEKFDVVIVDDLYNPCGILQAALKGAVYIYWSMTSMRAESAWANQSPNPPSYLPVHGTMLTEDMTFTDRVYNLAYYLRALYIHQHIIHPRIDAVFQKHYPGIDSAFDIERNASINFVNTPPIFDFARPYMPRVNFVGGLHCHKPKPLTGELAKFVESANDNEGFIVISVGFTGNWDQAPANVKSIFTEAMRNHPKTKFVWQFNASPESILQPSNVFIAPWLPLQDLLGHPKCKAHITHGGLNSVIESVYHGVPVLGIPLTVAGHDNVLRITHRDAGILLTKYQLDEYSLTKSIGSIQKQKYKDEMLVFQDMVRDVPYTELHNAAFWVGFIERHQEVPHARSGADQLNIIQYFMIDIIAFLISIAVVLQDRMFCKPNLSWGRPFGSPNALA
ncbi:unnamed protein product [Auanema sp. JU1783]|nr:unnamed protein product [Auanema sp. JU1783]